MKMDYNKTKQKVEYHDCVLILLIFVMSWCINQNKTKIAIYYSFFFQKVPPELGLHPTERFSPATSPVARRENSYCEISTAARRIRADINFQRFLILVFLPLRPALVVCNAGKAAVFLARLTRGEVFAHRTSANTYLCWGTARDTPNVMGVLI